MAARRPVPAPSAPPLGSAGHGGPAPSRGVANPASPARARPPASSTRARHGGARPGLASHGAQPPAPSRGAASPAPSARARPRLAGPAPCPRSIPSLGAAQLWQPARGSPARRARVAMARLWRVAMARLWRAARPRPLPGAARLPSPPRSARPPPPGAWPGAAATFRRAHGGPALAFPACGARPRPLRGLARPRSPGPGVTSAVREEPRRGPCTHGAPGELAAPAARGHGGSVPPAPACPARVVMAPARPRARPSVPLARGLELGQRAAPTRARLVRGALAWLCARVFVQRFGVARRARDATHSALSRSRHDRLPPSHPSTPPVHSVRSDRVM
jgi:hypothetical protein